MGKLVNTQIENAKAKAKEYNLADGKGLYLRVRPTGSKIWLFNYFTPFTKKRTNMGLGEYPKIKLAAARKLADSCRELLAIDIDPRENRDKERGVSTEAHENTLKAVADEWFKVKKANLSPAYAEDVYNSLSNHVFPKLGNKPIHLITAPETIRVLAPLAADGKLEMIKRICQRLNMVMDYAVNTGVTHSGNPLSGISKAFIAPSRKHFATIKPNELPELMKTIEGANLHHVTRRLFQFQLHTMTRPSEAAGARWEEIDLDNCLWNIPASRMKRNKAHVIPLTKQALEILEDLQVRHGHLEYVFPSPHKPKNHINNESVNTALKRIGYKDKLVSHGLRSVASSTLNEQGHNAELIEVALSHTDKNTVRSAYNHTDYLERRRSMMAHWSNHIEEAATGVMPSPGKKHLRIAS